MRHAVEILTTILVYLLFCPVIIITLTLAFLFVGLMMLLLAAFFVLLAILILVIGVIAWPFSPILSCFVRGGSKASGKGQIEATTEGS